jgi:hypothetical protein
MASEWTPDLHLRAFRFWTEGHTFEDLSLKKHTCAFCWFAASLTGHPSSFPCMPRPVSIPEMNLPHSIAVSFRIMTHSKSLALNRPVWGSKCDSRHMTHSRSSSRGF